MNDRPKRVAKAISEFDPSAWHSLVQEPLRTARMAVAQLPTRENAVIVFGIELADTDQLGEEYITDMLLAGVYVEHDGAVVFGHLDSSFFDIDYLMPVPASDEVFSSGAAVATAAEVQHAAVRNEMFRATMLEKQTDTDTSVHGMLVPVLVGAGIITE